MCQAQVGKALAGNVALGCAVRLESLTGPDLKAVLQSHDRDPVGQTKTVAQGFGQGDAPGGVETEAMDAAVKGGFKGGADRVAEFQLLDQVVITLEQRLAAASMDGKQMTPSNGPEVRARNSAGTTMRRLASSCLSNVDRNTSFGPAGFRQPFKSAKIRSSLTVFGIAWD